MSLIWTGNASVSPPRKTGEVETEIGASQTAAPETWTWMDACSYCLKSIKVFWKCTVM